MKRSLLRTLFGAALFAAAPFAATPARADLTVGFVTSLSGPASSIGILYGNGVKAGAEYRDEVSGEKIRLIQLDDGSDPSAATRDARKLVQENNVDILIGTSSAPSTNAMAGVAGELHVPMIAISPINIPAPQGGKRWVIDVVQPAPLMIKAVTDRMERDGTKTVGYIGFSDAWGDLVYNNAKPAVAAGKLTLTTDQRYTRTDTSVTGQILKLLATHPEGVLDGGSATQGALPLLALAERGYKGKLYGNPALVNADFIRVGGKAAEGIQVSTGPVIVADQLPKDHYAREISLAFREAYQKANGAPTTDAFSAYAFDAWLVMTDAAKRAMAKGAKPGTPEFREALNEAIFATKELAGTEGVYNFTQASAYGSDGRSLVVVRLQNGVWTFSP
jgi:branched-chain amino acid transport system substrate-binding protein